MCINVIQLKLEELFEELLLTMMEEYGDTGQTVEEITAAIKPRMSLVDLWKVWKRRRQRRSMQIQSGKWETMGRILLIPDNKDAEEMPIPPSEGPELEQLLAPPNARQQWQNSLSESNLRRVIKLFPFGRMRREAILRKLQLRFNQAMNGDWL